MAYCNESLNSILSSSGENDNCSHKSSAPPPPEAPASSSAGAFRPRLRANDPFISLRRSIKAHLNKLTLDSFPEIAESVALLEEQVQAPGEVNVFAVTIMDTAMSDRDNSEMYADLLLLLVYRCPPINQSPGDLSSSASSLSPSTEPFQSDSHSVTLSNPAALLQGAISNKLRYEYSRVPMSLDEPIQSIHPFDDEEDAKAKRRRRTQGLFVTTGHLFTRNMVGLPFVKEILTEYLYGSPRRPLEENDIPVEFLECVCDLIQVIGLHLSEIPSGPALITDVLKRLGQIRTRVTGRAGFAIDQVIEARQRDWVPKEHIARTPSVMESLPSSDIHGLPYGVMAQAVRKGRTMITEGSEYANYMISQEQMWLGRSQGIIVDVKSSKRPFKVWFPQPLPTRWYLYHWDDPPNAPAVDPTRYKRYPEDEPLICPGPPNLERRPQTPLHRSQSSSSSSTEQDLDVDS